MNPQDIPEDIISSLSEELLPGIPNDVSLDEIATKLPWRDIALLSSLSPSWQRVIESQLVYNARIRCHSLETFVVIGITISVFAQNNDGVYLYSPSEDTWYQLPEFLDAEFMPSNFIALDNKIYALGGISRNNLSYQTMRVLDLAAGDIQWQKCAPMLEPRIDFQSGVMDGKLYVFGGIPLDGDLASYTCGSELYDPKLDAWSPIKPMLFEQLPLRVTCLGQELFVASQNGQASSWQVYHPVKNEWRVVEPRIGQVDRFSNIESVFIVQGKFY